MGNRRFRIFSVFSRKVAEKGIYRFIGIYTQFDDKTTRFMLFVKLGQK